MSAYVIVHVDAIASERMASYGPRARETVLAHGGRPMVNTADVEVIEGSRRPAHMVMLAFPDIASARAWYASPEYQEIAPVRRAAADCTVVLVDGI